jgi:apolipoprotein D and lipocalin family protein
MKSRHREKQAIWVPLSVLAVTLIAAHLRAAASKKPLETVENLDLERYQGTWYEIARLPLSWERKCARDVTANYALQPNGAIAVINTCRKADGTIARSKGTARLASKGGSPSKLKVSFFWPFAGDYWVFDLDPDYHWALVGTPNRKYLWLLSRTPQINAQLLDGLLEKARARGFDTRKLITTQHS